MKPTSDSGVPLSNYSAEHEYDCGNVPLGPNDTGWVAPYGDTSCCGEIIGCMIPQASNFNEAAVTMCNENNMENGSDDCFGNQTGDNCCCNVTDVSGCMDPFGSAYSPNNIFDCDYVVPPAGTVGNTSCCGGYVQGCMDPSATNTNLNATLDCDGSPVISANDILEDPTLTPGEWDDWPSYNTNLYNTIPVADANVSCCEFEIPGCVDPNATNTCTDGCNNNDGSCIYAACPNEGSLNGMSELFPDFPGSWYAAGGVAVSYTHLTLPTPPYV